MIDMFVNKIVLYDDYFDIYFNTSDDESKNIKLDNQEDFEEIEKEQPSGSDYSHLVRKMGVEPTRCYSQASETCASAIPPLPHIFSIFSV